MRYWLISFMLVMLLGTSAHAQETEPAPFPPENPEIIFGAGVEVLDVRLDSTLFHQTNVVTVSLDYRAVILKDGRVYPFPEALANSSLDTEFQTFYGVYLQDLALFGSDEGVAQHWLLDLATGEYTQLTERPEQVNTICGTQPLDEIIDRDWIIVSSRDGRLHACNLMTGLMTPPLPDEYQEWRTNSITPQTLFLIGRSSDVGNFTTALVAYDFAGGELFSVGTFARGEPTSITPLADHYFLITTETDASDSFVSYFVDVSARRIRQVGNGSVYHDNPPRVQWWRKTESDIYEVSALNLLTNEMTSYEFAVTCEPEFFFETEDFYCRQLYQDRRQADVLRIDVETNARDVLYTGEVEQLLWLSDDERYIVFAVDDSGGVDTASGARNGVVAASNALIILMDTLTGQILFETPADVSGTQQIWMPMAAAIDKRWIMLTDNRLTEIVDLETATITGVEGNLGAQLLDGWASLYPYLDEYGTSPSISLYNLQTQQIIPVVEVNSMAYSMRPDQLQYLGDGVFEITVRYSANEEGELPPLYNLAVYQVFVPEFADD